MKPWPTKTLGEIATVIRGVSFDKSQVSDEPRKNSIPILRAGNIQDSLITDSDLVYVPEDLVSEEQRMSRGDLAICMSSGSPAIVGKTAHLVSDWCGSVGAFCAIVRFKVDFNHRFGSYWFHSPVFLQWRDNNAKGANIQNLRRTELEKLPIPVPPLSEQEQIVKLLDEADELRKLRAHADRRTAALIPALFHEMFGDPMTNLLRLPLNKLGSLCKVVGGGTPSKKQSSYWTGKIPWVSPKDMSGDEVHDSEDHISEQAIKESATNLIPAGSILVVTRSGILKRMLPIAINSVPVTINQDIKAFIPASECEATFLAAQLRILSPTILGAVRVGATVQNLETDFLKQLPVLQPSLSLQNEFARRVAEIRELEAGQAAGRARLNALFQSMLHRAFRGEL
ncbi:MAG: restriction endonuclease subunit S [Kiritimatiellia bacterium]